MAGPAAQYPDDKRVKAMALAKKIIDGESYTPNQFVPTHVELNNKHNHYIALRLHKIMHKQSQLYMH